MKELVFNTGGRKLFNEDFEALQALSKSFESFYLTEDPFVITGVNITSVSGNIYNVSPGYVWLGNRIRRFDGATNTDLTSDLFINVRDTEESKEYFDNVSRVSSRTYGSILSNTSLGGSNSLRISRTTDARRYVKDVLGGKVVLLTPFTTTQTVQNNLTLQGDLTVSGFKFGASGQKVTAIKTTVTDSHSDLATSKAVKDHVVNHGAPKGFIGMWSGAIAEIPSGWVLCDGRAAVNGQTIPNLKGKFIVGYDPNDNDYDAIGKTGGEKEVTLTEAQLPVHKHDISMESAGNHIHNASTGSAGSHSHTGSIGYGGTHSHTVNNDPYHTPDGTDYTPGEWGGTSSGNGVVATSSNGYHNHSITINSVGNHTHTVTIGNGGNHIHTLSMGNTGQGHAHENRPPFYTLAFIIKTV
ncbi:hypothetical protein JMN32_05050 [Fulvivirga sp. 29W222]|uniref:Phage tail collar domain-containing protein n=1 Tax=Fulvivirga marina TaxID=2494733 RepID=A0A937FTQ8_9BACT|nr:hypothetical protein [Fulvivirga marina]MBL6445664.1 hypothetical protein [Fulvivirga marina]